MDFELIFSISGILAMIGWLFLLVFPWISTWSNRIAGFLIPFVLSLGYTGLLLFYPSNAGGGFGSFEEITQLFSNPRALMAGWIHYLAFDLVVGAWICREGQRLGIVFWAVLPCLPLTFLFGPAGFMVFLLIRSFWKKDPIPS